MLIRAVDRDIHGVKFRTRNRDLTKEFSKVNTGNYVPPFRFHDSEVSYIPHVSYPWPLDLIKRIRLVDPGLVPVISRKVFISQTHTRHTFVHVGIARYDRSARPDPRLLGAARPCTGYFSRFPYDHRPNVIDLWFEGPVKEGSWRHLRKLPAPFVPFGEWVERMARETAWDLQQKTRAERLAMIGVAEEQGREAETRAALAEADYVDQGEFQYRKRLFESISPDDVRNAAAPPEPKPFVHLHSDRRSEEVA